MIKGFESFWVDLDVKYWPKGQTEDDKTPIIRVELFCPPIGIRLWKEMTVEKAKEFMSELQKAIQYCEKGEDEPMDDILERFETGAYL